MRRAYATICGAVLAAMAFSGCTVGPNYKRPAIVTPPSYRGDATAASETSPAASAASFGDEKWWEVFQDSQLQSLIRTALAQNYDVRIAAARIAQAQAQVTIARGNELPGAEAIVAGDGTQRLSPNSSAPTKRATRNSALASSGIWISGASTAAPQNPPATNSWQTNGRARK